MLKKLELSCRIPSAGTGRFGLEGFTHTAEMCFLKKHSVPRREVRSSRGR